MDWEAFYNSFRQPDFIPGYEIQNRLGGGAFGDVYKARKQSIGKAVRDQVPQGRGREPAGGGQA